MLTSILIFGLVLLAGKHVTCNKTEATDNQGASGSGVYFMDPKDLKKIKERNVSQVEWFTTLPGAHHASYVIQHEDIANLEPFEEEFDPEYLSGNETGKGTFNVTGVFLGITNVNITIYDKNNNTLGWNVAEVTVILSYDEIKKIFTIVLTILLFIQYINMGATIDLQVVKGIVVRPVGPIVGIFCQYVLMPVFAFGLAKFVFADDEFKQLGMFLNGASPGGGSSNMWTLLLGGSLDLSIMMTFASTIFAFGTIPMWVLTLGPKIITPDSPFKIPYGDIAKSVGLLIIPCSVGLLIQFFLPKVAKFLEKYVLKAMALFNLIFIASFGMYAYHYIFYFFTWKVVFGCIALPGMGYLSGFVISYLAKRSWKEIIAITIETGVQNATIPMVILQFTLGPPIGDLATVVPGCSVLMTPIPLAIALIIKTIKEQCCSTGINIKQITDTKPSNKENGYVNHVVLSETDGKFSVNPNLELDPVGPRNRKTNGVKNDTNGIANPAADFDNVS